MATLGSLSTIHEEEGSAGAETTKEQLFAVSIMLEGGVLKRWTEDGFVLGRAGVATTELTSSGTLITLSGTVLISAIFIIAAIRSIWKWQNFEFVHLDRHILPKPLLVKGTEFDFCIQGNMHTMLCTYIVIQFSRYNPITIAIIIIIIGDTSKEWNTNVGVWRVGMRWVHGDQKGWSAFERHIWSRNNENALQKHSVSSTSHTR